MGGWVMGGWVSVSQIRPQIPAPPRLGKAQLPCPATAVLSQVCDQAPGPVCVNTGSAAAFPAQQSERGGPGRDFPMPGLRVGSVMRNKHFLPEMRAMKGTTINTERESRTASPRTGWQGATARSHREVPPPPPPATGTQGRPVRPKSCVSSRRSRLSCTAGGP